MKVFTKSHVLKHAKQTLCVVLSLTLALFCVPAVAFAQSEEREQLNLVTLGDSYTVGWGLEGSLPESVMEDPLSASWETPYLYGYRLSVPGSYPMLFAQELESRGYDVNLAQLGQDSMRIDDLRILLDESYPADGFNKLWYQNETDGNIWGPYLTEMRNDYLTSIANADIITFDLGKNNFGSYLCEYILWGEEAAGTPAFEQVIGEAGTETYYSVRNTVLSILQTVGGLSDEDISLMGGIVDAVTYALLGYEVNLDATLDIIRDLNPDAEIVFVNLINPIEWFNVELYGITIPLGTIVGSLCDIANDYAMNYSKHRKDMVFANVDITGNGLEYLNVEAAAYDGTSATLTQNLKDLFDVFNQLYFQSAYIEATLADLGYGFGESLDPEIFENAKFAAYDAAARIYKAAVTVDPIPVTELLDCEDTDALVDTFFQEFCTVTTRAGVFTYINEYGYPEGPVSTLGGLAVEQVYPYYPGFHSDSELDDENALVAEEDVLTAEQDELLFKPSTAGLPEDQRIDVESMVQSFIDKMTNDKMLLGMAAIFFESIYGGGVCIHPSYGGQQTIANAIIKAYDEQTTAHEAYREYFDQMMERYQTALDKFGNSLFAHIMAQIEAFFTSFDISAEVITGPSMGIETVDDAVVAVGTVVETVVDAVVETVEYVADTIGSFFDDMWSWWFGEPSGSHKHHHGDATTSSEETEVPTEITGVLDETIGTDPELVSVVNLAASLDTLETENPHVHSLTHHMQVAATCTTNGIREYWSCDECGALFADRYGIVEITDASDLILAATGHKWVHHRMVNVQGKASGDPYDVCSTCGETTACQHLDSNAVAWQ